MCVCVGRGGGGGGEFVTQSSGLKLRALSLLQPVCRPEHIHEFR